MLIADLLENPILPIAAISIFPAALWVVTIVGWLIGEEIGTFEGTFAIGLVFGLALLAIRSSDPMISLAACVSLVISGGVFPFIRTALNRREHLMIDIGQMKSAYRQLDAKATNVGAKVQLAKMCYRRGLHSSAMALMEEAVSAAPDLLEDEKRMLRTWESEHGPTAKERDVRCPKCMAMNRSSVRYCKRCGTALLISLAGGAALLRGEPLRVFWMWTIAAAVLVVCPALALTLEPVPAILAVSLILLLSGILFYRILRSFKR
jgi:hypothetical protein